MLTAIGEQSSRVQKLRIVGDGAGERRLGSDEIAAVNTDARLVCATASPGASARALRKLASAAKSSPRACWQMP
jgi:hypothetical protein